TGATEAAWPANARSPAARWVPTAPAASLVKLTMLKMEKAASAMAAISRFRAGSPWWDVSSDPSISISRSADTDGSILPFPLCPGGCLPHAFSPAARSPRASSVLQYEDRGHPPRGATGPAMGKKQIVSAACAYGGFVDVGWTNPFPHQLLPQRTRQVQAPTPGLAGPRRQSGSQARPTIRVDHICPYLIAARPDGGPDGRLHVLRRGAEGILHRGQRLPGDARCSSPPAGMHQPDGSPPAVEKVHRSAVRAQHRQRDTGHVGDEAVRSRKGIRRIPGAPPSV